MNSKFFQYITFECVQILYQCPTERHALTTYPPFTSPYFNGLKSRIRASHLSLFARDASRSHCSKTGEKSWYVLVKHGKHGWLQLTLQKNGPSWVQQMVASMSCLKVDKTKTFGDFLRALQRWKFSDQKNFKQRLSYTFANNLLQSHVEWIISQLNVPSWKPLKWVENGRKASWWVSKSFHFAGYRNYHKISLETSVCFFVFLDSNNTNPPGRWESLLCHVTVFVDLAIQLRWVL